MINRPVISFEEYDFSDADHGFEDVSYESYVTNNTNQQVSTIEGNFYAIEDTEEHMEMDVFSPSIFDDLPSFMEFVASADLMDPNAASGAIQSVGKPVTPVGEYLESLMSELSDLLAPKEIISSEISKNRPNHNGGEKELSTKEAEPTDARTELSTEEVVRVAAARFVQFSARAVGDGDPSMLSHPFDISAPCPEDEDGKNVHLASLLLAAAEKVHYQQYIQAKKLLRECYKLSSRTGNPVQRVVYYFAGSLQERIKRDTGGFSKKSEKDTAAQTVIKAMLSAQPLQLVIQEKLPFLQLMQFTCVQTIIENVASEKRIHMVDLSIRHGFQWIILLQSLATRSECPIDYLKISAVGTSEEEISRTGKSLVSFAQTLNLHLIFKAVIVLDLMVLRADMFEVEEDEVIGAYSSMDVNPMIVRPETLDNIMGVIRRLKPCIMTVVDIEAKHNSPSFINRFTESLFFYSNYFDYLDGFMDKTDSIRLLMEECFHSHGIKNIVATEGSERVVRHVGINIWRPYFARFGFMETDLNEWSSFQASLLVKQFDQGSSCTLEKNGKSLIIGWKGTPVVFVSAWKFQNRGRR